MMSMTASIVDELTARFGGQVRRGVALAPYTSARIGGPADALVTVNSADELAAAIQIVWAADVPYLLLGGGSNVLVSDEGVRGITILNRAKAVRFHTTDHPKVWAESGV